MRLNFMNLAGGALTLLLVGAASSAQADYLAQDNANDPVYSGGGNYNGLNGGTGFQPWNLSPSSNGSNSGFFIGDATTNGTYPYPAGTNNINTNGKSFGIYANSGAQTSAVRPFTSALSIGQTFSMDFDNGQIDTNNLVGFALGDSTTYNRFVLSFLGGTDKYRISDGAGYNTGGTLPYTQTGVHADFTLTGASTYNFTLTDINSNAVYTQQGAFAPGSIAEVTVFNQNAGMNQEHNLFVNNLAVTTPAPSALLPMAGGLTVLFGSLKRRKRK